MIEEVVLFFLVSDGWIIKKVEEKETCFNHYERICLFMVEFCMRKDYSIWSTANGPEIEVRMIRLSMISMSNIDWPICNPSCKH